MVSMRSTMFSSCFLSVLNPRHRHSQRARIFDVEYSDSGPSPSRSTFERDLTEQLQKLNTAHNGGNMCSSKTDLASLAWLCQALDVIISTQESVKQALHEQRNLPERMVQQCMEDSVKMLDAILLLKETITGAHAHVKTFSLALRRLKGLRLANQGEIQTAQQALLSAKSRLNMQEGIQRDGRSKATGSTKKLRACNSMLRRMGDKLPTPSTVLQCPSLHFEDLKSTCSAMAAAYGGEICTIFFLRLLSMALSSVGGTRRPSFSSINPSPLHLSEQPAWGPALLVLQAQLQTEFTGQRRKTQRCGILLLPEICRLDLSLQRISEALLVDISSERQAARQDVRDLVQSTSMLVEHVQSAMARLCTQLDSISANLVDIRMALLDLTSCPAT